MSLSLFAAVWLVTHAGDSGAGSLRWAIEQANANPGPDVISLDRRYPYNKVVMLLSPLPVIRESVQISGTVLIDGTSAGPMADGLVIAADDVRLNSIHVQNFSGDGVVVQGANAVLWSVYAAGNRNGLRIEGHHADVRGGDYDHNRQRGIWITAGSSGNQIGVKPTLCIELCSGEPSGVDIYDNAQGIVVEGDGNVIDSDIVGIVPVYPPEAGGNSGDGIVVTGAHNTVINAILSNNGGRGVYLLVPARFENNTGGCNGGGFVAGAVSEPPAIRVARADAAQLMLDGTLQGKPSTRYTITIDSVPAACPAGVAAFTLIGNTTATTDASGFATWRFDVGLLTPGGSITATAAQIGGEGISRRSDAVTPFLTGETRADLAVRTTAPKEAAAGDLISFETTFTNNGPASVYARIDIPLPFDTEFAGAETQGIQCLLDGVGVCFGGPFRPGEGAVIRERLRVLATNGTIHYGATARLSGVTAQTDPVAANNATSVDVAVVPVRRHPARH